jgi:hypothetical protein
MLENTQREFSSEALESTIHCAFQRIMCEANLIAYPLAKTAYRAFSLGKAHMKSFFKWE